jgi:TonB family protein
LVPATLFPRDGAAVQSAKLTGEVDVTVGGEVHHCYVIEATFHQPAVYGPNPEAGGTTLWIDKSSYMVLKTVSHAHIDRFSPVSGPADMKSTLLVESLKLDQPLAAELFKFDPPPGAKQVDSFQFGSGRQSSKLEGKSAPPFKLEDLSGQRFELASLRGKPVLLDFWTTWCGPCKEEIPVLEKLHRDNPDLMVLGVDVGEDAAIVRKFLSENKITYPILLGGKDHMVEAYEARAFPSVVIIDKDAVIRNYMTGYGKETDAQLRAAIVAAGKPAAQQAATGGIGKAYKIGGGVTAPSVSYKVDPDYTERARKDRISGSVVLSLVVSPEGVPGDLSVLRSLDPDLDQKAIEAVSRWRFKPGLKNGQPVPVEAHVEVNFRLLDTPPALAAAPPTQGAPATAEEAYRRGMALIREKHMDDGKALLATAISMKPDWAQAYEALGRTEFREKNYSDAIEDFNQAIKLDSKHATWYSQRGLALSYSGRHEQAVLDYTKAIEMAPDASATPYNDRGWAYSELGQPEKGVADLTKAIEMTPEYQKAYENRAKAYVQLKSWPQAIEDLTSAIQLNGSAWDYRTRAEAKRSMGDTAGAGEDLRKAEELAKR